MGLTSTASKLQRVADLAETLYQRLGELSERLEATRDTVETTGDRVEAMEAELAEQRALLEALAEGQGVDVEAALAGAETQPDAEPSPGGDASGGETDAEPASE